MVMEQNPNHIKQLKKQHLWFQRITQQLFYNLVNIMNASMIMVIIQTVEKIACFHQINILLVLLVLEKALLLIQNLTRQIAV
ncbi:hypothetical protein D3C73_1250200 [compost metagenome]